MSGHARQQSASVVKGTGEAAGGDQQEGNGLTTMNEGWCQSRMGKSLWFITLGFCDDRDLNSEVYYFLQLIRVQK